MDLGLEYTRYDPAYKAHTDPILFFAVALWDRWVPREVLARALGGGLAARGGLG